MEVIVQVGQFMADSFVMIWSAIGGWGIFGVAIIAPVVLRKVGNLIRQIFQF